MLILAGVSLNTIVGDNGIVSTALRASIFSTFSSYKEEFEMNLIKYVTEEDLQSEIYISAFGENVKNIFPQ